MPKPFKPSVKLTDNDVTNEDVYKSRRSLLKSMGFVGASTLLAKSAGAAGWSKRGQEEEAQKKKAEEDAKREEDTRHKKEVEAKKKPAKEAFVQFTGDAGEEPDRDPIKEPETAKEVQNSAYGDLVDEEDK